MSLLQLLKKVKDGYLAVSHAIGAVMSRILLTVLWIVVFGIYAILIKCLRIIGVMHPERTGWQSVPTETAEHVHYQF